MDVPASCDLRVSTFCRRLLNGIIDFVDTVDKKDELVQVCKFSNSTFGVAKVEKFEIRNPKSETNSNFQMFK